MLVNVNKKLMLDDYEIGVLKKYNIDISNCNNLREVTLLQLLISILYFFNFISRTFYG